MGRCNGGGGARHGGGGYQDGQAKGTKAGKRGHGKSGQHDATTSTREVQKRDKFGKLYGRLKLGEIMECCRKWEGMRAERILEREHRPEYDPHTRSSSRIEERKAILLTEEDLLALGQIKPK